MILQLCLTDNKIKNLKIRPISSLPFGEQLYLEAYMPFCVAFWRHMTNCQYNYKVTSHRSEKFWKKVSTFGDDWPSFGFIIIQPFGPQKDTVQGTQIPYKGHI